MDTRRAYRAADSSRSDLTLARACVAEIGFSGGGIPECRAMWGVLLRRVGIDRVAEHATRYNSLFKRKHSRRAWVLRLDESGEQPRGWPSNERWSKHRDQWLAILAAAEKWMAHPTAPVRADHYGGSCARPELACDHVPAHWIRVRVPGDFAQAYWQVGRVVLSAREAR